MQRHLLTIHLGNHNRFRADRTMTKNYADALIGFFVLTVATAFLIFLYNGRDVAGTSRYEVYAEFLSANGISVGSDVRVAGVKIGEVTAMTLDPSNFLAKVKFVVADDLEVPDDSVIAVSTDGLLGDSFLEILPGGSVENIAAGGKFLNTQDSVDILTVLAGFRPGAN